MLAYKKYLEDLGHNVFYFENKDNFSTVEDILLMSNYLIKNYPDYYEYFKEKTFTWDRTGGDPITQGNRNPLLYKNFGADGIKTGYLAVEKYSLASSIKKGERRLIAVGSGFDTKNSRSRQSKKLLTWGLTNFDTIQIAKTNSELSKLQVWLGKKNEVQVYVKEDIYKTIPKARKKNLKAYISIENAKFQTVRHRDWRWFDFLWMTHTMDYEGRDDFNNTVLRIFSLLGLITVFSGFSLWFVSSTTVRKFLK